ncbi:hypothetical protein [Phycicoccus sonneratiae]|uniref:Uncharacterized protein n=1 Tax=Phycicoccus sonneratiae TaxID=2807628 RepID=A0ABS2CTB9_9MICO|nr:hypothetical protein [Phycicoccus sonneraticus]MBM6402401.1 hypothetical protein [Phycicoccus sonneraticus]
MTSSLSSRWTCQQCGRAVRGEKHVTSLGRTICTSCQHDHDALVLGSLSGGGFGDVVAVRGARRWIRRALGRDPG